MKSLDQEAYWAAASHLVMLINLVTGVLGIVATLVLYLVFRRRSDLIAYHALQSLFYQLIFWLGGLLLALLLFVLAQSSGTLGICLMVIAVFFALIPPLSLAYGVFGATEVRKSRDFSYPLVGNWALAFINR